MNRRTRTLRFKLKLGRSGRRLPNGAIAGAFSRTAVAPLETIRTHMMVGSHGHSVSQMFHWICVPCFCRCDFLSCRRVSFFGNVFQDAF